MIYCLIYSMLTILYNLEQSFSFVPPFFWTNINEFDNWTVRGSAINLKSFIRLTPAIKNKYGALCQRIPTLFRDWSVKIQFATSLSNNQNGILRGGRGFWFHYTENPCPMIPIVFNGICIWINTTVTDTNETFPLYFIQNNNSVVSPKNYTNIGRIKITKDGRINLNISRIKNNIYVYADTSIFQNNTFNSTSSGSQILIYKTNAMDLIQYGYFTISALTTENAIANNDLIQIQTIPYSNYTNEISSNLSQTNRKIINNDQYETRKKKKQIRRSLMKTVEKYSQDMKNKNTSLTNENQNLSSAFIMLDEIKNRALSTITLNALMSFIDTMMNNQIDFAYQKLEFSSESLNLIKNEIDDIWSKLRNELISMADDIHNEMDSITNETINAIRKIKITESSIKDFKLHLKKQTKDSCNIFISRVLLSIIIVEIIFLSIYMIYARAKLFKNTRYL